MEETETDIEVLLECLKCQKNDPVGLKRTLSTLLSILGSNEKIQEYFRESGGLHDVQSLLSKSIPTDVQQAAMHCLACAVENNVFSQNALVNAETFSYLHQCLSEQHSRQYMQTAAYLLMCLVTNNSVGQNLARESSCLSDALVLFRQCSEVNRMTHDLYEEVLLLWASLTAALNGCVNNPQNEANQRLCSTILPLCFKIIAEETHHELCGPLLLFVGLTVSGNKLNQDRVRQSGGLDTMLNHLQKSVNRLELGWRDEQHVLLISNALSSSMTDNEQNIHFFLEHGGLHVLFSLLESLDMACDGILGVVIAIGHVLEFAENRFAALTSKEQGKLIKLLTETQSEELVHAVKYVLSQCQELAEGAENRGEEQTKIRSKIDELLTKLQHTEEMECLDDGQTFCGKGETAELRQNKDSPVNHLQGPSSTAQGQTMMSRIHPLCSEHGKSVTETLHRTDLEWAAFQYFKQLMSEKCPLFDQKDEDASHVSVMLQRDGCKNSEYAKRFSHQQPNVNDQSAKCCSKVMKSSITRECGSCQKMKSKEMIKHLVNEEKLCNEKDKNSMSGKISVSDDHAKSEPSCGSENTGQTKPYCSRDLLQEENRPSNSKVYRNPKCRCKINPDGCVINKTTKKCIYHDSEARADTDTQMLENSLCLEDHSQQVCCFVDTAKNYTGLEKEQTFHNKVVNCHSKETDLTDGKALSGKCPHQATKRIHQCIHTKMRNKNALLPHCISGYLVSSIGNSEREPVLKVCECSVDHTGKRLYLRDESQPCDEESTFCKCCKCHKGSRELGCLKTESSRIQTPCKESEAVGSAEIGVLKKLSHSRFQSNECSSYLMNPGCRIDSHHFLPETCTNTQGNRRKGLQNACCPCSCHEPQSYTTSIRGKLDVSNNNLESSGTSGTAQDCEAQDGLIVSISEEKNASSINNKSYANNHGTETHQTSEGQTHLTHEVQNNIYFTVPDEENAEIQIDYLLPKFKSRIQQTETDVVNKKNSMRKATCSDVKIAYPLDNNPGTGRAERKEEHERGTATETGAHEVRRTSVDLPSPLEMPAVSPARSEFDIALSRAATATRKTDSKNAVTKTRLGSILDVRRPSVRPSSKRSAMDVGHDSFFRDSDRDSQPVMRAHGIETRDEWSTDEAESETRSLSAGSATSPAGSKDGSGLKAARRENKDGIPTDDKNTGETVDTSDTSSEVYSVLEDSPGMRQLVQHVKERREQKCPGCCPSEGSLALNSRTFNIVLETSSQTCQTHRNIRQAERDFILKRLLRFPPQNKLLYRVWKKKRREREELSQSSAKKTRDSLLQNHCRACSPSIYNFYSSDSDESRKITVSPPSRNLLNSKDRRKHFLGESLRRQRVAYSEEELKWLIDGVKTMGTRWRQIRHTYPFHPSRTPADLKEKYQRIKDSQRSTSGQKVFTHSSTRSLPLSMCEIRRLKRGVATIGHNWTTILRSQRFAPGRTAEELREKWRVMNRKKHM